MGANLKYKIKADWGVGLGREEEGGEPLIYANPR
jgi:hypothetical protein